MRARQVVRAVSDENKIDQDAEAQASSDGRGPAEAAESEGAQKQPAAESASGEITDLETAKAKAAEYLDGWQRAVAELANYKKRTDRERTMWQDTLTGNMVLGLLPILDDFDRAAENLPEDGAARDWANGILLIQRKLKTQLENLGLQEIEAEGQEFDPELHEAVTHEASTEHQPGEVIGVLRKGYRIGDKVLRPALVRVSS